MPLTASPEIARAHSRLRGQLIHAENMWNVAELMASGETNNTLNAVAPGFFNVTYKALVRAVLQTIRDFTDPADSRVGKQVRRNASLEGLLRVAFGEQLPDEAAGLPNFISAAREAETVKQWVNRGIAHSDWETVLGNEPLPELKPAEVVASLTAAKGFLVAFGNLFGLASVVDVPADENLQSELRRLVELLRNRKRPNV